MKKYIILCLLIFTPAVASASFTTNLYYGKVEKPKSCPGTAKHAALSFIETTNSALMTISGPGTIKSSMVYSQRRVNEAEHCNLNEKQAEKVSKNYEKQYEKTEKKVIKLKNNNELVTRVSNQNLAQTKQLTELSGRNPQKAKLSERMVGSGNKVTASIVGKTRKDQLAIFREKVDQVKKIAKEKFAPTPTKKNIVPPTPAPKPQGKTEAQIREEEDCLPGETLEQCMEEDWDGKYYSAEEYERANGLR